MDYQWFPGHMAKAIRQMKEDLRLIDLIIEIVDARLPFSSSNPVLDEIAPKKPRLIIMNKSDMANSVYNDKFKEYFIEKGYRVVLCDAKNKKGINSIVDEAIRACSSVIERNKAKGLSKKVLRAMVVGIPNVGKSTIINALAGKNVAKTGNKPGVTKGKQWIRIRKELELLDTPGILWPKFSDQEIGRKIAFIGSINVNILITEELAYDLLKWLSINEPNYLKARLGIDLGEPLKALEKIARKRGCLIKGGNLDLERASNILIEEFRNGKLGRVTLDRV